MRRMGIWLSGQITIRFVSIFTPTYLIEIVTGSACRMEFPYASPSAGRPSSRAAEANDGVVPQVPATALGVGGLGGAVQLVPALGLGGTVQLAQMQQQQQPQQQQAQPQPVIGE